MDLSALMYGPALALVVLLDKLQKSQVIGLFSTFLQAYSSLSKPFFPCNMDGLRRSYSTTIESLVSRGLRVYCVAVVSAAAVASYSILVSDLVDP